MSVSSQAAKPKRGTVGIPRKDPIAPTTVPPLEQGRHGATVRPPDRTSQAPVEKRPLGGWTGSTKPRLEGSSGPGPVPGSPPEPVAGRVRTADRALWPDRFEEGNARWRRLLGTLIWQTRVARGQRSNNRTRRLPSGPNGHSGLLRSGDDLILPISGPRA
jgi:hypothetical protein